MDAAPKETLLETLTRFDATQLAPWMGFRNALGVVLSMLAGVALHNPSGGLIAATGALDAAFSDGSDPYLHRARRMLTATAFVSLAVFAGRWCGGNHALAITLEAACAFAAGMLVAAGQTAGDIGTITLVTLIVFSAEPATLGRALTSGLLVGAGGLLQTLLSIALWPVRRHTPEARALATLFASMARAAESEANSTEAPPATEPILAARASLAALGSSRDVESERYLALFSQAERMRLGLLTLARLRTRIGREPAGAPDAALLDRSLHLAARILSSIAASLSAGVKGDSHPESLAELRSLAEDLRRPAGPENLAAMRADARWQLDALLGQLRTSVELAAHASIAGAVEFQKAEAAKPRWLRLAGVLAVLRANLTPRAAVCRHAIRLAVCVALADYLARGLHWERAYWAPMTAAIVLKPDFTTTFSRGVLRLAGTLAGLALATAIFAVLQPGLGVQMMLVALFMFSMRWAGGANYGILVVALTGLVVLLFAFTGVPPAQVAIPRGLNTLAGGIIALTANRLWPTWERTRINEALARLLDAYRAYFQAVRDGYLHPGIQNDRDYRGRLEQARQAGRVARSNLEASFQRFRIEPGVTPASITPVLTILANSHRFIHAVMALEAGIYRSEDAPPREEFRLFTNDVDTTLYFLAAYMRGASVTPGDLPDLRERHRALENAGDRGVARYALVNVETGRVTNSLNSLAVAWALYRAGVESP